MADDSDLVPQLNALLYHLAIPEVLASPRELTPTLLLAILESLLRQRLTLPDELRKSRSQPSRLQLTKAFLGALSDDILRCDLQSIDPSRLAEGLHDETFFVGQILCSMGREAGLDLDSWTHSAAENTRSLAFLALAPHQQLAKTPVADMHGHHLEIDPNDSTGQPVYMRRSPLPVPPDFQEQSSNLTHSWVTSSHPSNSFEDVFGEPQGLTPRTPSPRPQAHIVAVPDSANSVRYHGWIDAVHGDIEAFEAHRVLSPPHSRRSSPNKVEHEARPARQVKVGVEHTAWLMHERARLLAEIAFVQITQSKEHASLRLSHEVA